VWHFQIVRILIHHREKAHGAGRAIAVEALILQADHRRVTEAIEGHLGTFGIDNGLSGQATT